MYQYATSVIFMADSLIHIRVGKEIKKEMNSLIEKGLFTNQTEIAREAIRDLMIKYISYSGSRSYSESKKISQKHHKKISQTSSQKRSENKEDK